MKLQYFLHISVYTFFITFFLMFSARFSLAENIEIYKNDHQNRIIIQNNIGSTGDASLFFGNALAHSLEWDNTNNLFVFSDDVDFTNHQIKNVRIENNTLASKPCDSVHSGEIFQDTNDMMSYVCSGAEWRQLNNSTLATGGLKPYLENLDTSTLGNNVTADILVAGGNFTPNTVFTLTAGATLNATTVNSDISATLNVTTGSTDTTVFVEAPNSFGNTLSFTIN